MSYRITRSVREGGQLICVEGELDREGAAVLRRECELAGTAVQFDLSGLIRAERTGIEVLQSMVADGAELTGASPYILLLLNESRP